MIQKAILVCLLLVLICAEKNYTDVVKQLKKSIEDPKDVFYHSAYNRLAFISDTYGPRVWGSSVL